jgi:hypothetical protein
MPSARRYPPPWTVEEANDARFIVRDPNGQALNLGYFSSRMRLGDAWPRAC